MKLKINKILLVALVMVVAISAGSCGDEKVKEGYKKPLVVMITDTAGLGDKSFNDEVWKGCEKAESEKSMDIRCVESKTVEDFGKNIDMSVHDGATVIVCSGFAMAETVAEKAPKYPKVKFILIDGEVAVKNVTNVIYENQEGAFLAGVAAAYSTKSGKVAYVGGVQDVGSEKFQYGFTAGFKAVKPEGQVFVTYIGTANDKEAAKKAGADMSARGSDVVFYVMGSAGMGMIEAARENNFKVISFSNEQGKLDSKQFLCSINRSSGDLISKEILDALDGTGRTGTVTYNLAKGSMKIDDKNNNLSKEAKEGVEKWSKAIKSEKLVVPFNDTTFKTFVTPRL